MSYQVIIMRSVGGRAGANDAPAVPAGRLEDAR
jgi:hypothetical protein